MQVMQAVIINLPMLFDSKDKEEILGELVSCIEKGLTNLLRCEVKAAVSSIDDYAVIIRGEIDFFHPETTINLVHFFGESSTFHRVDTPVEIVVPKLQMKIVCS